MACIGFFGFAISRFSYAWLIGAVTANLVMLMAFTQPQGAFTIAVDRVADVVIGYRGVAVRLRLDAGS